MAKVVTNQAKNTMLDRYGNLSGPPAAIQSLSVDDSTTALSAGTTTLGSPTNLATDDFDSISRSGQTVTITSTFAVGVANFTHRRLVVHNAAAASVTGTSATVQFGHDQQTIIKNSTTQVTYTVQIIVS